MSTIIKAKQDLFNRGKCFTRNMEYTIPQNINQPSALIDVTLTNDLGQPHIIGMWWRQFEIIEPQNNNDDQS